MKIKNENASFKHCYYFLINVLSKVNKKWDEKLDIVSGSFIWCGVAICISLYNGISFDGGIHYNFEAMKSYCKNRAEPDTDVGVRPDAKTEFNRTVKRLKPDTKR